MNKEKYIKQIINEELTKAEVRKLISDEVKTLPKDREFKKEIENIVVDVFDKFFHQMWSRKSMWKSGLKNG